MKVTDNSHKGKDGTTFTFRPNVHARCAMRECNKQLHAEHDWFIQFFHALTIRDEKNQSLVASCLSASMGCFIFRDSGRRDDDSRFPEVRLGSCV